MTTTTFTGLFGANFVVPDQCTEVTFDVKGAGGGGSTNTGKGSRVRGTLPVTPGDVLAIKPGGAGQSHSGTSGGAGGSNGGGQGGNSTGSGGSPGAGGGGASTIRRNGTLVVVAGGGGGESGSGENGGTCGYTTASADGEPHPGAGSPTVGQGGIGGYSTGARGAPGTGASDTAQDGVAGTGGHGSNHSTAGLVSGGGGGGGALGGGGGGGSASAGGGGGAGSDLIDGSITGSSVTPGGGAAARAAGTITLTYNVAPNQPNAPLIVGANIDVTVDNPIFVLFSDDDPGDAISRVDVRWRVGSGAWNEIDSLAYTLTVPFGLYYTVHPFPANFFATYIDSMIEFQARVYDSDAAVSPWSPSSFVTVRNPPTAATITPAVTTIDSLTPTLSWTTPDGMVRYQIEAYDAAGTTQLRGKDSGLLGGSATSGSDTVPSYAYVNFTSYQLAVRWQQYDGVWSPWAFTGPIVANINAPLQPTLTLTASDDTASVRVDIANPGSDPHAPLYNDVYRQNLDDGSDEVRLATLLPVNGSYTDFTPGSRATYRYRVNAVNATTYTSSE